MINYKIISQNFEVIRDQIGAIITLELENQASQFYNTDCEGIDVYIERSAPIDKIEMSMIIVSCAKGDYDNRHAGYVDGEYTYNVDVFTNSKTIGALAGDKLSALKNHRLVGIVRAILEDPIYKTLGFVAGSIGNLRVSGFEFGEIKKGETDALNSIVGRLTVTLKAEETSRLIVGEPLFSALTQIKLNETDFGLRYEFGFPDITITAQSLIFADTSIGSYSASQNYQVSAVDLTANLIITAPSGFIINIDNSNTNSSPITLVPVVGTVALTTIYVKFNPVLVQSYTGNVINASSGATTMNVAVSGAGIPITPGAIANLQLWLDAVLGATTNGSTPATDGTTVQQWNDQSGNNNNATQLTGGSRPTYKTNIFNSKPTLRFAGSQNMNTSSFLGASYNTAYTFFIVANKVNTTFQLHSSNNTTTWYSGRDPGLVYNTANLSDNQITVSGSGSPPLSTDLGIEVFRYNGATKLLRFITATNTIQKIESATGNLGLSGALTIGSFSSGSFMYIGDISEYIIYNRALTDDEVKTVEDYLAYKYWSSDANLLPLIIFDGDSITAGVGSTGGQTYPRQAADLLGGDTVWASQNDGVNGQTMLDMISLGVAKVDPYYSPTLRLHNIVSAFGGTNDLNAGAGAATTYSRIVTYCTARRAIGFKVIIVTILPRNGAPGTFEADRQTVNTNIRNNWASFADALADVAANSTIGDNGDQNNTTYYADGVHLTNAGYAIVASIVVVQVNILIT